MLLSFIFFLTVSLETNYLRIYWINLHQLFKIGRYIGGHDTSNLFGIAQGTLLYVIRFCANQRKFCAGIPQWMGKSQNGCARLHCRWPFYVWKIVNFDPVTHEICYTLGFAMHSQYSSKSWTRATTMVPSAIFSGVSDIVEFSWKHSASGPCDVIMLCKLAPPGWKPFS